MSDILSTSCLYNIVHGTSQARQAVANYLKSGGSADAKDRFGQPMLHLAVANASASRVAMVWTVLDGKPRNVDVRWGPAGRTPLHSVARR